MKTPDIQCGIASSRRRGSGEAPDIGRVSRLRGGPPSQTGTPHLRRRGAKPNAARKRVMLIWSAILGTATLTVLGVVFALWVNARLSSRVLVTTSEQTEDNDRIASKFPSPSREQALEQVKRAVTNRNQDQISSLFRMGGATSSEIMDFLKSSEQRDGAIERYDWLSSQDSKGLLLEGVLVVYKNGGKPVERIAFLTPDESGDWKLDFDAFARSIRPSWKDLLSAKANDALVRVLVGRDYYYNGLYHEKEWICYTIASPDMEELLRGYCKVGSPEAAEMEELFAQGRKMCRATLQIHHNKQAESKQFEITRIVAGDWVVAEVPERRG
jgi:hypothetical protein